MPITPFLKIIADVIGWIGNVCFIGGAVFIARKQLKGFWWQIGGNLMYFIQGVMFMCSSLWAISLVLISINIWGLYTWKTKGVNNE